MKERKNKPEILFICPLPPPVHGSSIVSQNIKDSSLLNEAFEMDFVNLSTSRKMEEIDKRSWALYARKALRFFRTYAKTLWLLTMRRYNLCYLAITCHGVGFLKDAPFVLLCKLFGRKIVIHQHNKGMSRDVDRPVYRWLLPLVYKNTKVILLSWHLYPDIEKVVKRENVMICPNGIKPTVDNNFERKPNEIPHILFLSNLLIDKGVLVLLDALKILKDRGYSFVCDFVGSETKDIDATRFAKEVEVRGLDSFAIYHGRKYGTEKEAFFKQAEVFVLPSFNEAFPLVNIEAMEYKLPIISTNVGGVPDEVVENENGYIVKGKDSIGLAGALCKLLDDPSLRMKMGEDGYKKYKEKFTDVCFENQLVNVLKSVIGGGNIALVNYWGRKYGDDKEVFWRYAEIFVFPTFYYNECFPLVILEAMMYGLPVISTDEGGIRDEVKDGKNGFVVKPQDATAIADAIGRLLDDKVMRERMGEEGRRIFKERFTMKCFENNIKRILIDCVTDNNK